MLIELSGMGLYREKYHHNAKQSSHKFTVWQAQSTKISDPNLTWQLLREFSIRMSYWSHQFDLGSLRLSTDGG